MPNTCSQEDELEQPIYEVERYIRLRYQLRHFRLKYNLPDPDIPEPDMDAPANHPLRDYATLSRMKHTTTLLPLPSIRTISS